ncbi:hypothetical protein Q6241_31905, partial [Klebsiella pneumoniae]
LRLMFFGNLHQDWSEFVLADLGIYTYEKVEFCAESRGLRSRDDVHGFLFLHQCQQAFERFDSLALGETRMGLLYDQRFFSF